MARATRTSQASVRRWSHSDQPASRSQRSTITLTLLVIDNRPLRNAAWAEFHRIRKQSERANADLQRHEQVDQPAFREWMHRTFPVEITELRRLHEEVELKAQQVRNVEWVSDITGRSAKQVWRELKKKESAQPTEPESDPESDPSDAADPFAQFFDEMFGQEKTDPAGDREGSGQRKTDNRDPWPDTSPRPHESSLCREIYRRLVQRLHPDRGGDWTPERERLWHEVQTAWAARDGDWLARLEINWETANDILRLDSPIGRIRQAIVELHAGRRDAERKLRAYRKSTEWRFTLNAHLRSHLQKRTLTGLHHDLRIIQEHLRYLNSRIDAWEKHPSRKSRREREELF